MDIYQNIIQQYISGVLTDKEKASFEKRLVSEPNLKEAYELELASRKLVKIASRKQLKDRLNQMENRPEAKIIQPVFTRKRLLLAASLIIGLVAGYWLLQPVIENNTTKDIFAAHFAPYRPPVLQRGDGHDRKNDWETGIESYGNQKYSEAIIAFEKALNDNKAPAYLVHFYIGQSLLAQNNSTPGPAIESFKKVFLTDNFYQQQAKWYMALAYLQLGETIAAIALLEELEEQDDFKKEEVKIILEAVRK